MKNHLLILLLMGAVLLTACTSATAETDLKWHHKNNEGQAVNHVDEEVNDIQRTPQEAVDKINALYEGSVVEVELDKEDGLYYYEIEIMNGEVKYKSKMNADNLEIIKLEKGEAEGGQITSDAAFDIAAEETGGEVLSWELDDNVYEIIVETEDELVKTEIDALTEELLSVNVQNDERDDADEADSGAAAEEEEPETKADSGNGTSDEKAAENDGQQNSNGPLTPQEAMNIALSEAGGIVIEWEYDEEDFVYEIELNANGQEVDVEIDSRNGAVLEVDYD